MSQIDRLLELEKQLQPYNRLLGQAADVILNEQVSKYPIFVMHQQEVEMGISLVSAGRQFSWSIEASTLEEFVSKNLIFMEKAQDFINAYKDPEEFLCLFVLSELGAQFIFVPRQK